MDRTKVWAITSLVGLYLMCQLIADIGATKMVQVGTIIIPGGTFIFTLTFTLRDLIHKRLGVTWSRASIVLAGVFNLLMAGYLAIIGNLPAPVFFGLGDAWNSIFAFVPSIVLGSIAAEVVSELIDTEVYQAFKTRLPKSPQWSRVLVSNGISLPIDSLIFASLAFTLLPRIFGGDAMPFSVAWSLVVGQITWKGIVTIISMPLIYLVKEAPHGS